MAQWLAIRFGPHVVELVSPRIDRPTGTPGYFSLQRTGLDVTVHFGHVTVSSASATGLFGFFVPAMLDRVGAVRSRQSVSELETTHPRQERLMASDPRLPRRKANEFEAKLRGRGTGGDLVANRPLLSMLGRSVGPTYRPVFVLQTML
jgi:hypothetical protein